jgi:hypothetical protein
MSTRPPMTLNQPSTIIEYAYFIAIILLSAYVYIQTQKMSSFSFHRGIRYFRNAFLSFTMVYSFRLLVLNLQLFPSLLSPDIQTSLIQLGMFLVAYFSFLAIFALLSSFSWKHFRLISDTRIALLALVFGCVTFFAKLPLLLLVVGAACVVFLALKAYGSYRKKERVFLPIFVIYALLLVFILFDLVPAIQEITPIEVEIVGYLGAICVFAYINLKVRKVLTAGTEEEK